jgi:hypothetical protein
MTDKQAALIAAAIFHADSQAKGSKVTETADWFLVNYFGDGPPKEDTEFTQQYFGSVQDDE